jgi:branched-chain amino acid transport system permease protein
MIPTYYITVMTFVCINILLSLSVGVLTGYAGQISLGQAAFMGIGAYTAAFVTTKMGLSCWLGIPCSVFAAAIVGFGLGLISLRLKDDFLAIATMGFNFVVVGVLLYAPMFGRALGMGDIPMLSFFDNPLSREAFLGFCVASVVVVILVVWWLQRSWVGLAWRAIREVQEVAEVMGVNITKYKIFAFVVSTAIAGFSGYLYAHFVLFITPYDFVFTNSTFAVTLAVLGGMGTIRGPVLGAIILTVLPEYLRFIQDYRMLTYGLLLVVILLFQPEGLIGNKSFLWRHLTGLRIFRRKPVSVEATQ